MYDYSADELEHDEVIYELLLRGVQIYDNTPKENLVRTLRAALQDDRKHRPFYQSNQTFFGELKVVKKKIAEISTMLALKPEHKLRSRLIHLKFRILRLTTNQEACRDLKHKFVNDIDKWLNMYFPGKKKNTITEATSNQVQQESEGTQEEAAGLVEANQSNRTSANEGSEISPDIHMVRSFDLNQSGSSSFANLETNVINNYNANPNASRPFWDSNQQASNINNHPSGAIPRIPQFEFPPPNPQRQAPNQIQIPQNTNPNNRPPGDIRKDSRYDFLTDAEREALQTIMNASSNPPLPVSNTQPSVENNTRHNAFSLNHSQKSKGNAINQSSVPQFPQQHQNPQKKNSQQQQQFSQQHQYSQPQQQSSQFSQQQQHSPSTPSISPNRE